jgi:threonine dehydrogenase-like Zn-dependent dehydrogenase
MDLLMTNFHWYNCLTVNFKSGWVNVLLKSIINNCFIVLKQAIYATKIISHPMKLDEAPKAYDLFDKKADATKIIFKS